MVLYSETLVFVTTAIAATVAEVESCSTFRETCLATEVEKVSRNRPCYMVQRLLKHVLQRPCTQVSAKSFNVLQWLKFHIHVLPVGFGIRMIWDSLITIPYVD